MKILGISDFDIRGSGYMRIMSHIGQELAKRGHEVISLGLDYDGTEHDFGFAIVPTQPRWIASQARIITRDWKPKVTLVVSDLTWHEKTIELSGADKPLYVGIFAIEGGPMLTPSPWAAAIRRMDLAYSISQFGSKVCQEAGLKCEHIPIGVDSDFWMPLDSDTRQRIRKMLSIEDKFVILTVADNQERKNLPCAIEAVARLRDKGVDVYYILVTKPRPNSIGWNLWAEARKWKMERHIYIAEQGCPVNKLREYYGMSDAFLLTAKAEGLCLPILEAMACGTPCVASQTCSIPYMLKDRGLLIEPEYEYTDPFGNTRRQFVSAKHAAEQLYRLAIDKELYAQLQTNGLEYASGLTWEKTVDVLERDIHAKIEEKEKATSVETIPAPARAPIG